MARKMIDLSNIKNGFVRQLVIENTHYNPSLARARVRLDCKAPDQFDEIDINGVCKPTDLLFYISFYPVTLAHGEKKKRYKPFILRCNLLTPKGMCRLHGWSEFAQSTNPVLVWIRENTNVGKSTFRTAADNPYLKVPFSLNYAAYAKKTGTYCMTDYRIAKPYTGSRASTRYWEKEAGNNDRTVSNKTVNKDKAVEL